MDYFEYVGSLLDKKWDNRTILNHLVEEYKSGDLEIPDQIYFDMERSYLLLKIPKHAAYTEILKEGLEKDMKGLFFGKRERLAGYQRQVFQGKYVAPSDLSQLNQLDIMSIRKPDKKSLVALGIINEKGNWSESCFQKMLSITEETFQKSQTDEYDLSNSHEILCLHMNDQIDLNGSFIVPKISFNALLMNRYRTGKSYQLALELANAIIYPQGKSNTIADTITKQEYKILLKVGSWFVGKTPSPHSMLWPIEMMVEACKNDQEKSATIPKITSSKQKRFGSQKDLSSLFLNIENQSLGNLLDIGRLRTLSQIAQDVLIDEEPSVERLLEMTNGIL